MRKPGPYKTNKEDYLTEREESPVFKYWREKYCKNKNRKDHLRLRLKKGFPIEPVEFMDKVEYFKHLRNEYKLLKEFRVPKFHVGIFRRHRIDNRGKYLVVVYLNIGHKVRRTFYEDYDSYDFAENRYNEIMSLYKSRPLFINKYSTLEKIKMICGTDMLYDALYNIVFINRAWFIKNGFSLKKFIHYIEFTYGYNIRYTKIYDELKKEGKSWKELKKEILSVLQAEDQA